MTGIIILVLVPWRIRPSGLFQFWINLKLWILWTVCRTHLTADQPVARPLPTQDNINTEERPKDIHASSGIRTHDHMPSCLRPLDHCDRRVLLVSLLMSFSLVVSLRLALSNGPKRLCGSTLLPGDGNRPSFRNVVFFRIPEDGQSPRTQQSRFSFSVLSLSQSPPDGFHFMAGFLSSVFRFEILSIIADYKSKPTRLWMHGLLGRFASFLPFDPW
jgi:hypothetical protein